MAPVAVDDEPCVHFGRYRGRLWEELPEEYLLFICSTDCLTSEANKRRARLEVFRRLGDEEENERGWINATA